MLQSRCSSCKKLSNTKTCQRCRDKKQHGQKKVAQLRAQAEAEQQLRFQAEADLRVEQQLRFQAEANLLREQRLRQQVEERARALDNQIRELNAQLHTEAQESEILHDIFDYLAD